MNARPPPVVMAGVFAPAKYQQGREEGGRRVCTTCGCCGGSTFKIYNPGNMGPGVGGCTASA